MAIGLILTNNFQNVKYESTFSLSFKRENTSNIKFSAKCFRPRLMNLLIIFVNQNELKKISRFQCVVRSKNVTNERVLTIFAALSFNFFFSCLMNNRRILRKIRRGFILKFLILL